MQISYTLKVWLSGLLFTPVIYILLVTVVPGFRLHTSVGLTMTTIILPYTFLISVWTGLTLFATIQLSRGSASIKRKLSIMGFLISFAAMLMINSVSAFQNYGGGYVLAFAYAFSTALFIWLYELDLSPVELQKNVLVPVKDAIVYGLTVWLFTFLFSTPVSILAWIAIGDFKSISTVKTAQDILERYNLQLSLSVAFFITIVLTALITINLDIMEKKKKAIIFLFAFPISFPLLFYYLLFSGDIYTHQLPELISLVLPSIIVSALSIWGIDIIPGVKAKS